MRGFPVATSGGEAADSSDRMSESQSGSEGIARSERRHVVFAHIPRRGDEGGEQTAGEDASGLKRSDAKDLAGMGRVVAPLVDDVENFRAENSAEDNEDSEIPRFIAVVAEPFGVAYADPETQQDPQRDEESVGWQEEASVVKELWEH